MSRIGKAPITIPSGVEVKIDGHTVSVKGPKGTLSRSLHPSVKLLKDASHLTVALANPESLEDRKYFGLSRTLVANMVEGVSKGFQKSLTLVGVGYRAAVAGNDLQLTLGFSHPVVHKIPQGITASVDKQTVILLSGPDKELIGQTAADIRGYRPPEPYHGKGVRYSDEVIATKVGKAAGKK